MPVLLFIFWLIFNGRISVDVIVMGLIVTALITWFLRAFTDWSVAKDLAVAKMASAFVAFLAALLWEMLKANIHMIALVLSDDPDARIDPMIVYHKTNVRTSLGKTSLANSITLTPGTVTVDTGDGWVCVHAIDNNAAKSLKGGKLEKRLEDMEKML